ncbi:phosphoglycerate mutase family protein [[Clostridium] methylpentosum DSM 5476]|uniref:Phosphoglycerate mutase family protein n=1 Tax=[Clostridium] methylpentosum DSM 5476 TaxID=537013 RepID=C0EBI0_9FIRM|nr:phosphoglycerate mutase family protein [[Clostridium] methylpentosum DSM 5476]MDY3988186.1 histidine phosphatase family protein [Massilioclostridium sp.]MEE1490790.1 histidine phosphatase family protein [Massilioclostridium sp.]
MKTFKIHLIRHGITQGNLDGKYIGATDLPLCEEGIAQLGRLADEFEYPRVQKVYASPLRRAVETAELIYPDNFIQKVDSLREYNFGQFENRSMEELQGDPAFTAWMDSGMTGAPEGGESREQFEQRLILGFNEVILDMMRTDITSAALVSHGGVLMYLLSKFGLPQRRALDWQIEAGKGYTVLTYAQLWARDQYVEVYDPLPYGAQQQEGPAEYNFFDVEQDSEEE